MPWDLKPLNGRGWILSDYSSGKREPSCASSTLECTQQMTLGLEIQNNDSTHRGTVLRGGSVLGLLGVKRS